MGNQQLVLNTMNTKVSTMTMKVSTMTMKVTNMIMKVTSIITKVNTMTMMGMYLIKKILLVKQQKVM